MKRITLFVVAILAATFTFGQSQRFAPEELEKMESVRTSQERTHQTTDEIRKSKNVPSYNNLLNANKINKGLTFPNVIDVLILSPDEDGTEALRAELASYDHINATSFPFADLPDLTLSDLTPYHVVIAFNNNQWLSAGGIDPDSAGDIVASYIDGGGLFVESSYLMDYAGWEIGGSYSTDGYSAFTHATNDIQGSFSLGTIIETDHPVLTDFSTLSITNGLIQDNQVAEGAVGIAEWDNGEILVAAKPNVVSLNLLPMATGMLNFEGDGVVLYNNAIVWLMNNLADPASPASPADLTVTAAEMGTLEASLAWTNPSESFDGEALTELDEVRVYRNNELITTISDPVIGGEETYTDDEITSAGMYSYSVQGLNTSGEGLSAAASVYVGEDVPAAPAEVTLTANGNNGVITWNAPTEGLNGGYMSGTDLTYTVVRLPDMTTVAEDLSETTYEDNTVPEIGNYQYAVTASNLIGEGGTGLSNAVLLGADGFLVFEGFEENWPPLGWNNNGWGQSTWGNPHSGEEHAYSNLAGSTLNTPSIEIPTEGVYQLSFFLAAEFSNYPQKFNLNISVDGGDFTTLDSLTGYTVSEYVEFIVPLGDYLGQNIVIQFEGLSGEGGLSFGILIDDVSIFEVLDNDLAVTSITGNTSPSVGIPAVYTVEVLNSGNLAQSDYTVKLMKGDTELDSEAGIAIDFTETASFELTWTPLETDLGAGEIYAMVELVTDEAIGNNMSEPLSVNVQSADISAVTIGDGEEELYTPFNFRFVHSLSQTLYYPEEIGLSGGVLTAIQYTNLFDEERLEKPIKIWVGETDATDLTGGWVDPASLQLVYDGTLDFPAGQNNIMIPFDDIYVYGGGNLVIYAQKDDTDWSGGEFFLNTMGADDSNRTIRAQQDSGPLDPLTPPADASTYDYFPNITMFFSTDGLGSLAGTVTDGTDPLEEVMVKVLGTNASTLTDAEGAYEFPYLLPNTYNVEFSKFGYETTVEEAVVILEDETTVADASLSALVQYTVTGTLTGNDGLLVEGALVTLEGYDSYTAETDANGEFTINDVFEGEYELGVSADGYDAYTDEAVTVDADIDLDITLTETIIAPGGLMVDVDNHGEGNAMVSWMLGGNDEFRYDDGLVTGQLGFDGDINSVMGHVIHNSVQIDEVSWYLTDEGGPYETLRLIILGLDENGLPDRDNVLYENTSVPNVHMEWNTYELSESVTSEGVFVGIGAGGFLGLATDDGLDEPYEFIPGTQYGVFDITDPASAFTDILDFGFEVNYLLRSFGIDFGPAATKNNSLSSNQPQQPSPILISIDKPFDAGEPQLSGDFANKAFTGYNVFLDGSEVAAEITETEYLFEDLAEGTFTAGVQSVYTTGTSDIIEVDFEIVYSVEVTINVTTNSGDSPDGASVLLTNQEHDQYTYSHTVADDGVAVLPAVKKGMYTLEVTHDDYHPHMETDVSIMEDMSHTVELVEIIDAPFGLLVETEGMEAGEAMFSWNNDLGPVLGESFETGEMPEGWTQVINNNTEQAGFLSTWHITGEVSFDDPITPQDGDYQAFMMWSYDNQDEWLITPELTAPNGDLVFWYHGTNGSPNADNYYVKVSTDGGDSWDVLWNASDLPEGDNHYATPAVIDLSDYAGQDIHIAWNNVDGPTNDGVWYAWAIDNITIGGEKMDVRDLFVASDPKAGTNEAAKDGKFTRPVTFEDMNYVTFDNNKAFVGYNVYLDDELVETEIPITETVFTRLEEGTYTAGVQSVYTSGTSEIQTIDFEITNGVEDFFANVQIIHNAADAAVQSVDIYAGDEVLLSDVDFRTATAFLELPAEVEIPLYITPAGEGLDNAVGPVNVTFDRDETYVVIASGIVSDTGYDPAEPFALHVYQPARQAANAETNTDLLVFHGATDAPEVSVWAQGVTNQLFAFEYGGFAGYLELPTNDYVLEVRDAAGENTLLTYDAPLSTLELEGAAITVVASGFLAPENNSDGPAFGLWVATAEGGELLELPVLTSVQDLTFDDGQISVFPNPSNSVVNFHSNDNMKELRMLDLSGRVVFSSNVESDQYQVNVRNFESGIYFVQIVTTEGIFTGKLQVQK